MRHLDSLLHSLILCAAVACVVAQLCASSLGVDSTPAVLLRCVLALALCCAPWSLQPFARAQRHLAHQNLGGALPRPVPVHEEPNLGLHVLGSPGMVTLMTI